MELPKGWRELYFQTVCSEPFGEYCIWIDKEGENTFKFTLINKDHKKENTSKRVENIKNWHMAIKAAQEFAFGELDAMHTRITQALDMYNEVFGEDGENEI